MVRGRSLSKEIVPDDHAPRPRPSLARAARLQQTFVADILPRVEAHGRVYFRHVRCPHQREELLAEMVGLCWKWFLRLVRRGKDVLQFVSALASYAARAVRSGRRVCGRERRKEVLSPVAQRRHGFAVGRLPDAQHAGRQPAGGGAAGQHRLSGPRAGRLQD